MPHNFCQWSAYAIVAALGIVVAYGIQALFMEVLLEPTALVRRTRKKMRDLQFKLTGDHGKEAHGPEPILGATTSSWVGGIEIVLYSSSVVFKHPEFIGIWFATKYVANFRSWGKDPIGRAFYNRSLFGSGLNILVGFFTGLLAIWCMSKFGPL